MKIRNKAELLEKQKAQLTKDFDLVRSGDTEAMKRLSNKISHIVPEVDEDNLQLDPESRQKLINEKAKIEQLREEIKRTHAELLPDIDEFDAIEDASRFRDLPGAINQYVDEIVVETKDDTKRLANNLTTIRSHFEEQKQTKALKKPTGLSKIPGLGTVKKQVLNIPTAKRLNESQLPVHQEEEPIQRQSVQQSFVEPLAQPLVQPNIFPMYPQTQTDPALIQSLVEIKNVIEEATEKNKSLEEELKRLKESKVPKQQISIITPVAKTRQTTPVKKEIALPEPSGTIFAQNEDRADDLEEEEKALLNLAAQEYDSLQMLSRLDPESDLYKYKLQQYKEMSAYRANVEKALQKQRLEKISFDLDFKKKQMAGVVAPELNSVGAIEKEKRKSLLASLHKQYAAQAQNQAIISPVYDQSIGFSIGIDFAFNLPQEVSKLQVVYGVFSPSTSLMEALQVGPITAKPDKNKPLSTCIMNYNKTIKFIPAVPDLQLILEVQGVDLDGSAFTIGWSFINLFDVISRLK